MFRYLNVSLIWLVRRLFYLFLIICDEKQLITSQKGSLNTQTLILHSACK